MAETYEALKARAGAIPDNTKVREYLEEIQVKVDPSQYRSKVVERFGEQLRIFFSNEEAVRWAAHTYVIDWLQEKFHKDRVGIQDIYDERVEQARVEFVQQFEIAKQRHIEIWQKQFPWNIDSPLEFSEKLPKDCDDCED